MTNQAINEKLCESRRDAILNRIDILEAKLVEREKIRDIHIKNLRENVELAKSALDHRLEGMNEIRKQLSEQASTFASCVYVDGVISKIEERIANNSVQLNRVNETLLTYKSSKEGGREANQIWIVIISIVASALVAWAVSVSRGTG